MTIKLVLLKSGEEIIADVKEGVHEDRIITYIFDKPHKVIIQGTYKIISEEEESVNRTSISLYPWPNLSADKTVHIVTDWVVTVVEPNVELKKMYEQKVLNNGKQDDQIASFTEQSNSNISN